MDDKNLKTIRALQAKSKSNKVCFECKDRGPSYLAFPLFGEGQETAPVFVCVNCAGLLRNFNFRVKGISMSTFTPEEMEKVRSGGNSKAAKLWLAKFDGNESELPQPGQTEKIRRFIAQKYQDKVWTPSSSSSSSKKPKAAEKPKQVVKESSSDSSSSDSSDSEAERRKKAKKKAKKKEKKERKKKSKKAESSSSSDEVPKPKSRNIKDVMPEVPKLVVGSGSKSTTNTPATSKSAADELDLFGWDSAPVANPTSAPGAPGFGANDFDAWTTASPNQNHFVSGPEMNVQSSQQYQNQHYNAPQSFNQPQQQQQQQQFQHEQHYQHQNQHQFHFQQQPNMQNYTSMYQQAPQAMPYGMQQMGQVQTPATDLSDPFAELSISANSNPSPVARRDSAVSVKSHSSTGTSGGISLDAIHPAVENGYQQNQHHQFQGVHPHHQSYNNGQQQQYPMPGLNPNMMGQQQQQQMFPGGFTQQQSQPHDYSGDANMYQQQHPPRPQQPYQQYQQQNAQNQHQLQNPQHQQQYQQYTNNQQHQSYNPQMNTPPAMMQHGGQSFQPQQSAQPVAQKPLTAQQQTANPFEDDSNPFDMF